MAENFLRTVSTIASAGLYDPSNSLFAPKASVKTAPVMRETQFVNPLGNAIPGSKNVRFILPKNANVLGPIWLTGKLAPMTSSGNATIYRYANYVGLLIPSEIRVRAGTQQLQVIKPEQIYFGINKYFDDEQRLSLQSMVLGPLSGAERVQRARKHQKFRVPIPAFWTRDPSTYLHLFGISQDITIEIDFAPSNQLVQANGTWTTPATDAAVLSEVALECEYFHTLDSERDKMIALYGTDQGVPVLYDEFQYAASDTTALSAATATSSQVVSISLNQQFNKPAHTMVIFARWAADLSRTCGLLQASSTLFGDFGYSRFNVDGWTDPKWTPYSSAYPTHGNPSPVFAYVEGKSNNNYWLQKTPVENLVNDTSGWRYYHGGGGAILCIPFAMYPTTMNACTGALDFSACPNAVLNIYVNTSDWTQGGCDYTTVGNYATADIGESSALQIDVMTVNLDTIKICNHGILKPIA